MQHSDDNLTHHLNNSGLEDYLNALQLPTYITKSIIKDHKKGASQGLLGLRIQNYLDTVDKPSVTTLKELEEKLTTSLKALDQAKADIATITAQLEAKMPQDEFLELMDRCRLSS